MESSSEPGWLAALVALGPPLIWTALIVTLAMIFKDPISKLAPRGIRASTPIGTLEVGPTAQETPNSELVKATAEASTKLEGQAATLKWIPGSTPPVLVGKELVPYFNGQKARNDDIDLAIYWFTTWSFELIYRVIWGTQIQLLQIADINGKVTRAQAEDLWNASKAKGNIATFDAYIGFLTSSWLLGKETDQEYGRAVIGHQFLVYLSTQSIPTNKSW